MGKIASQWIGLCDYGKACAVQEQLVADVLSTKESIALGFEHPVVITQGIRGTEADLHGHSEIPVYWMRRGGGATIHSPGQLVIYPILALREHGLGIKDYVCLLETTTQKLLQSLGVHAERVCKKPGLFTPKGKICFVGLQVHRGVSFHGISVNVSNDLSLFSKITPCGMEKVSVDSLAANGVQQELPDLFARWVEEFNRGLAHSVGVTQGDPLSANKSCPLPQSLANQ